MTRKILLVDDTPDLLESITFALRMESFDVLPFTNAIDALATLQSYVPDLIMTDLSMQVMDGFEFIEKIRAVPHLQNVPVAIFSARPAADNYAKAMALGVSSYIFKPCTIEVLVAEVEKVLKNQNAK